MFISKIFKRTFAIATIVALSVTVSVAQDSPDTPEADPADVESVDAIMAAVYDVISGDKGVERDWDRFRSLFRPDAKLIPNQCRPNTACRPMYMSVEDYVINGGAYLEANGFFENEIHRVQERFGNIVHLFSTYESRRLADDPEPFARGINSFQLMNDGSRWWVVNIFWEQEGQNNPIPAKYLPAN
ncbi:MAG: hypothetical protein E2O84_04370 [Bacteroidetes bacterium]|nr:MAG: hypothetical protein E2O84_04370 [Bacteroidota bacterium]